MLIAAKGPKRPPVRSSKGRPSKQATRAAVIPIEYIDEEDEDDDRDDTEGEASTPTEDDPEPQELGLDEATRKTLRRAIVEFKRSSATSDAALAKGGTQKGLTPTGTP